MKKYKINEGGLVMPDEFDLEVRADSGEDVSAELSLDRFSKLDKAELEDRVRKLKIADARTLGDYESVFGDIVSVMKRELPNLVPVYNRFDMENQDDSYYIDDDGFVSIHMDISNSNILNVVNACKQNIIFNVLVGDIDLKKSIRKNGLFPEGFPITVDGDMSLDCYFIDSYDFAPKNFTHNKPNIVTFKGDRNQQIKASKYLERIGIVNDDIDGLIQLGGEEFANKYKNMMNKRFALPKNNENKQENNMKIYLLEEAKKRFNLGESYITEAMGKLGKLVPSGIPKDIEQIPSSDRNKYMYRNHNKRILFDYLNNFMSLPWGSIDDNKISLITDFDEIWSDNEALNNFSGIKIFTDSLGDISLVYAATKTNNKPTVIYIKNDLGEDIIDSKEIEDEIKRRFVYYIRSLNRLQNFDITYKEIVHRDDAILYDALLSIIYWGICSYCPEFNTEENKGKYVKRERRYLENIFSDEVKESDDPFEYLMSFFFGNGTYDKENTDYSGMSWYPKLSGGGGKRSQSFYVKNGNETYTVRIAYPKSDDLKSKDEFVNAVKEIDETRGVKQNRKIINLLSDSCVRAFVCVCGAHAPGRPMFSFDKIENGKIDDLRKMLKQSLPVPTSNTFLAAAQSTEDIRDLARLNPEDINQKPNSAQVCRLFPDKIFAEYKVDVNIKEESLRKFDMNFERSRSRIGLHGKIGGVSSSSITYYVKNMKDNASRIVDTVSSALKQKVKIDYRNPLLAACASYTNSIDLIQDVFIEKNINDDNVSTFFTYVPDPTARTSSQKIKVSLENTFTELLEINDEIEEFAKDLSDDEISKFDAPNMVADFQVLVSKFEKKADDCLACVDMKLNPAKTTDERVRTIALQAKERRAKEREGGFADYIKGLEKRDQLRMDTLKSNAENFTNISNVLNRNAKLINFQGKRLEGIKASAATASINNRTRRFINDIDAFVAKIREIAKFCSDITRSGNVESVAQNDKLFASLNDFANSNDWTTILRSNSNEEIVAAFSKLVELMQTAMNKIDAFYDEVDLSPAASSVSMAESVKSKPGLRLVESVNGIKIYRRVK